MPAATLLIPDPVPAMMKTSRPDLVAGGRRPLSRAEFAALTADATVLSQDEHGLKVIQRPDGRIIKLFRRNRWLSSALLDPYAVRFARASLRLEQLGIQACKIESLFRVPHLHRDAVVYPRIEGVELRQALQRPGRRDELMPSLAGFVARLHCRGVYYRGLHFANVLLRNEGDFALLDVSETRFFRNGLTPRYRARNFRPMIKYKEDRAAMAAYGPLRFVQEYLGESELSEARQDVFVRALRSMHDLFRVRS